MAEMRSKSSFWLLAASSQLVAPSNPNPSQLEALLKNSSRGVTHNLDMVFRQCVESA